MLINDSLYITSSFCTVHSLACVIQTMLSGCGYSKHFTSWNKTSLPKEVWNNSTNATTVICKYTKITKLHIINAFLTHNSFIIFLSIIYTLYLPKKLEHSNKESNPKKNFESIRRGSTKTARSNCWSWGSKEDGKGKRTPLMFEILEWRQTSFIRFLSWEDYRSSERRENAYAIQCDV
jgi:hypothetical protein